MFEILTKYLFEFKHLVLPKIGVFDIKDETADTDFVAGTITPPAVVVAFTNFDEADHSNLDSLYDWLVVSQSVSKDEAKKMFGNFVTDIQSRLKGGEMVDWAEIGTLKIVDNQIDFVPATKNLSPFTSIAAKKIVRENTSYATTVGDKETTTSQMREELLMPKEKKSKDTVMWVLFTVAAIAAIVYFTQNGCNKASTGNQQKVESSKPEETYRVR